MKTKSLTLLLILSFSLSVFAHGDMEHVLGTVVKVSDHLLSVRVTDGTIKDVLIDDETRFFKGTGPATFNEIKVGMRVVIHAHKHQDSLHAVEVKIAAGSAQHPASHKDDMI